MKLLFKKLNEGWNAEPNAPMPKVTVTGNNIELRFRLNYFLYNQFSEKQVGAIQFTNCSQWRLGSTNDEGWYRGQCRYSYLAPEWGEFYEIVGNDPKRDEPSDWRCMKENSASRHFLFYLRDETFECMAEDWQFSRDISKPWN